MGYFFFLLDGNCFFFVLDCFGGSGGYDIYVLNKIGNFWSLLENLGFIINFSGDEIILYFDGMSLFFVLNWYFGLGGMDVF